ncbi:P-loop NTPase fold protein [Dactylosporangium sp. NPDC050688]|uniref:P-loop NTPase fold protein n=1 Tax=Dactylosporangium sp. NPDC050688 TaxID=3157217 RepID=UPI0033C119B0
MDLPTGVPAWQALLALDPLTIGVLIITDQSTITSSNMPGSMRAAFDLAAVGRLTLVIAHEDGTPPSGSAGTLVEVPLQADEATMAGVVEQVIAAAAPTATGRLACVVTTLPMLDAWAAVMSGAVRLDDAHHQVLVTAAGVERWNLAVVAAESPQASLSALWMTCASLRPDLIVVQAAGYGIRGSVNVNDVVLSSLVEYPSATGAVRFRPAETIDGIVASMDTSIAVGRTVTVTPALTDNTPHGNWSGVAVVVDGGGPPLPTGLPDWIVAVGIVGMLGTPEPATDEHRLATSVVAVVQRVVAAFAETINKRAVLAGLIPGITGFGDRPPKSDQIDRSKIAEAVAASIIYAPSGEDDDASPRVVSLEGPWGTGKTTLLGLLREKVQASTTPTDTAANDAAASKTPTPTPGRRLTAWGASRLLSRADHGWDVGDERRSSAADTAKHGKLASWIIRQWQRRTGSRLVRLVRPDLSAPRLQNGRKTAGPTFSPITVWFNPWSHQSKEQIWAGLAGEIATTAVERLCPTPEDRERYWFSLNIRDIDRRRVQQELHRRVRSPMFRLAVFALTVPILARLADPNATAVEIPAWIPLARTSEPPVKIVAVFPILLFLIAAVNTWWRFAWRPATDFLPADLFQLPVLGGALLDGAAAGAIADPLYRGRAGKLQIYQHAVRTLAKDARRQQWYLIVFIDDLDRCQPQTIAEVFEGINAFVASEFEHTRFVLAMDPAVVAAHLNVVYAGVRDAHAVAAPEDPDVGWAFMRKLIQLPVILPVAAMDPQAKLLTRVLGQDPIAPPQQQLATTAPQRSQDPSANGFPDTGQGTGTDAGQPALLVTFPDADTGTDDDAAADPLVMSKPFLDLLAVRLRARPDCSLRELKRMLTVWQYYVRVAAASDIVDSPPQETAGHLLILAEIVTRWPSLQARLHCFVEGDRALQLLAKAATTSKDGWDAHLAALRLNDPRDAPACKKLRALLRDHDGVEVAALAAKLM